MKTYRDFEWVLQDFPGFENSIFVTYVRDSDPRSVIDVVADDYLGAAEGLPDGFERYPDQFTWVAAGQLDDQWTVTLAEFNIASVTDGLMRELSIGRQVLTHSKDTEAVSSFLVWEDGQHTVGFDPLLRYGFGGDPLLAPWVTRMTEVGIDPETGKAIHDGLFHVPEASFAMAANYLGVNITPDFLDAAPFEFGR